MNTIEAVMQQHGVSSVSPQQESVPIQVVDAICINKKKQLLLVLKEDEQTRESVYILPGGKVNLGESQREALVRELHEELSGVYFRLTGLYKQCVAIGTTPFPHRPIEVAIYAVAIEDYSYMEASSEIDSYAWLSVSDAYGVLSDRMYKGYDVSNVTIDIIEYILEQSAWQYQ